MNSPSKIIIIEIIYYLESSIKKFSNKKTGAENLHASFLVIIRAKLLSEVSTV